MLVRVRCIDAPFMIPPVSVEKAGTPVFVEASFSKTFLKSAAAARVSGGGSSSSTSSSSSSDNPSRLNTVDQKRSDCRSIFE